MIIAFLGDIHAKVNNPVNRKDDYGAAFWNKMNFIFDTCSLHDVDFILQPGDFFDKYGQDSLTLIYDLIIFLKHYEIPVYSIYGQHDLRFHNLEYDKLPINILNETDYFNIIKHQVIYPSDNDQHVVICGSSFGQDTPNRTEVKGCNILVTHQMIIKKKKLWPDQTEYVKANKLLSDTGFDIIVSGDNHQGFMINNKEGQMLFNCGSLMRSNIDQIDHQPRFYIFDTTTGKSNRFDIPIDDPEDVFRLDQKIEKDIHDYELGNFTTALNVQFKNEFSFKNNLKTLMKENKISDGVKHFITGATA